jgi:hypothetical protein
MSVCLLPGIILTLGYMQNLQSNLASIAVARVGVEIWCRRPLQAEFEVSSRRWRGQDRKAEDKVTGLIIASFMLTTLYYCLIYVHVLVYSITVITFVIVPFGRHTAHRQSVILNF